MSAKCEMPITCPKCGKQHPFGVWSSINTKLDPEMKQKVKDRSAFLFECPSCKAKTYVDYGLLYHQMEDKIMIYYVATEQDAAEADRALKALDGDDPTGMMEGVTRGDYLIRVVRSQHALREKISIFDEGLDDRIIEIFKVHVFALIQKDHPEFKNVEMIYLRDADEQKNYIHIIADGKPRGVSEIPPKFYQELCIRYAAQLPSIRESGPYIDRDWAMSIMGLGEG